LGGTANDGNFGDGYPIGEASGRSVQRMGERGRKKVNRRRNFTRATIDVFVKTQLKLPK
jgi:hypothetical protein